MSMTSTWMATSSPFDLRIRAEYIQVTGRVGIRRDAHVAEHPGGLQRLLQRDGEAVRLGTA